MLDEYFMREDVLSFVRELEKNPKYLKKNVHEDSKYGMQMKEELALYLFYDIIFKYKILIDDIYIFPDFLSQIEKLFLKIEYYDDMILGVYKLFIKLVATFLDVKDIDSIEGRNEVVRYFYQKYVVEGYLIHGYCTTYQEYIQERDFIPEKYPNHYSGIIRLKQIFAKYGISVVSKDFQNQAVYFTDDFVMACHYSAVSPGYIYELVSTCCNDQRDFLKQDYSAIISSMKRFMNNHSFSSNDQRNVLRIFEEEWNYMYSVPRKINLLLVKKNKLIELNDNKLNDYLDSDKSLELIVEKIMMPKYHSLSVFDTIPLGKYQMITLDRFYQCIVLNDNLKQTNNKVFIPNRLLNSYGVVSILLIVGSLFITFGVIITVIMILGVI